MAGVYHLIKRIVSLQFFTNRIVILWFFKKRIAGLQFHSSFEKDKLALFSAPFDCLSGLGQKRGLVASGYIDRDQDIFHKIETLNDG